MMQLRSAVLRRSVGPVAAALLAFAALPAAGQTLPVDGYRFTQVGLTVDHGPDYEYTEADQPRPGTNDPPLGLFRFSDARVLNARGQVVGISYRFNDLGTNLGYDSWFGSESGTLPIGLVGDDYDYTIPGADGGLFRYNVPDFLNRAGQSGGYSYRYNESRTNIGRDAWLASTGGTTLVGLVAVPGNADTAFYEYAFAGTGGGTYRYSEMTSFNAAGQGVGFTRRNKYVGGTLRSLGRDAWIASVGGGTQLIGLTGADDEVYEHISAANGGPRREGYATSINDAGFILGHAHRYSPDGGSLGVDAWLIAPGGTAEPIGFVGPWEDTRDVYRFAAAAFLNAVGQVGGRQQRFTAALDDDNSLGFDAWIHTPGSPTRLVGLVEGAYPQDFTPYQYNNPAQFGGGIFREGQMSRLNDLGYASGYNLRFSPGGFQRGQDAWLATPGLSGLNLRLGFSNGPYQYGTDSQPGNGTGITRYSLSQFLNTDGYVAGYNLRYNAGGQDRGRDVWLASPFDLNADGVADGVGPGTDPTLLNLVGGEYEFAFPDTIDNFDEGILRYGDAISLNDSLQATGISRRYAANGASLGQAGWFYDEEDGRSVPLIFSTRVSDGFSYTEPRVLTTGGVVLGTYTLYGGTADAPTEERRAFWWSAGTGFHDLGAIPPNGGPNPAGWNAITDVDFAIGEVLGGAPEYIVGNGLTSGQPGGQSVYVAAAVPEPAALSLLALPALALLRRRRRR